MKNISKIAAALLFAAPLGAFAATTVTNNNLESIIAILGPLITDIVRILDAFAFLGLAWGTAMFVWNAGDEKKRAEGKNVMIWGIIGLFVLTSVAGLLSILQATFSLQDNPQITYPSANPKDYNIGG